MRVRSDEFTKILNLDPNIFNTPKRIGRSNSFKSPKENFQIQSDLYYCRESIHIEYISITYNYESVRMLNDLNSIRNSEVPKWMMMKLESNGMFEEFVRFVEEMVKGQVEEDTKLKNEKLKKMRKWAQEQIDDGGYWGAEAVSKRILDFAKSISGGDKSKIPLLRDAVKKAFDEVREKFGGKLPEVSEKTYELVMKGFEEWENSEQ